MLVRNYMNHMFCAVWSFQSSHFMATLNSFIEAILVPIISRFADRKIEIWKVRCELQHKLRFLSGELNYIIWKFSCELWIHRSYRGRRATEISVKNKNSLNSLVPTLLYTFYDRLYYFFELLIQFCSLKASHV